LAGENMSGEDPKGYYKYLGVRPDAPISVIKAAYRALAMELHPDRNKENTSTADFQALQQAYAVLSNEKLRQQYDADSSVPVYDTTSEKQKNYKPLEPIVCSKCGAVSALPRFKVFYTVFGYIFGAIKKPHQGVFCSKCEIKEALKCSSITMVTGWWSIHGFVWTCQTLIQNLVGGRFNLQNAQLQGCQAMYFAQIGKIDLARAVAIQALKLAEKATKENNNKFSFKKKLGYDTVDTLSGLKDTLTDFINSFAEKSKVVELKSTDRIFNKRFVYQLVLLATFASLVFGEVYWQDRQAEETERIRLEKLGIDSARAAAIAAKQAEVLKSMEEPLPTGGILRIADWKNYNPDRNPPLKINNSPDANTLMKLVRVSDGAEVMSIFIHAGQVLEVAVPVGSYKVKIASGQTWYGDSVRFGPTTSYATLDSIFTFTIKGRQLLGHEVTLTQMRDGNLKQLPLSATDF
jgi:hypothetical protein